MQLFIKALNSSMHRILTLNEARPLKREFGAQGVRSDPHCKIYPVWPRKAYETWKCNFRQNLATFILVTNRSELSKVPLKSVENEKIKLTIFSFSYIFVSFLFDLNEGESELTPLRPNRCRNCNSGALGKMFSKRFCYHFSRKKLGIVPKFSLSYLWTIFLTSNF